jgi:hypothetical protein
MVELTSQAAEAVEGLRPAKLPGHQILRIARDPRSPRGAARLTFVAVARPGDVVGESRGISLCVGEDLAEQLAAMVLDVRDGEDAFFVRERQPTTERQDVGARRGAQPSPTSAPRDEAAWTVARPLLPTQH